jgi:hypothetical protein
MFDFTGVGNIIFNYTIHVRADVRGGPVTQYSGIERLDKNYIEVILPLAITVQYVQLNFTFTMEEENLNQGTNATQIALCEITMHGNV